MVVASEIRNKIDSFQTGHVFTMADFALEPSNEQALAKLLSRMVASGEIVRVSKGKYYKPKKTVFGVMRPAYEELVKDLLMKGDEFVGYISGGTAFSAMGLTTQISSNILIGTNKYRHPIERGGYKVSFLLQSNPITQGNIELLQILDAVKMIRKIPGTSPTDACKILIALIKGLDEDQTAELERLSLKYTNYVRAIVGAILELLGRPTDLVRCSLNGVSSYKLPIAESVLPTKNNWRIYETARK